MEINKEEIMMILGWFGVKSHEVDIEQKDIDFLHKIQPLCPPEFTGIFERYYERFEQVGY